MLEGAEAAEMDEGDADRRGVLHEDKKYYPTALEVYGEGVETTVQEEDTQPITQPIVAPIKPKKYDLVEKGIPATVFDRSFLPCILKHPGLVRKAFVTKVASTRGKYSCRLYDWQKGRWVKITVDEKIPLDASNGGGR